MNSMFKAIDTKLLFSRNDTSDPRLGELVKQLSSSNQIPEKSNVIIGYPDDEGIKLIGGREGAKEAPNKIRQILYKMTPDFNGPHSVKSIYDLGNLDTLEPLPTRHNTARQTVTEILDKQCRLLTLGGGHDYGYPDMAAFCKQTLQEKRIPFIINFDAHLDARPDINGENSGTSFYKLLNEFEKKIEFFEVGVQPWCNSSQHLDWVKEKGGHVITLIEYLSSGVSLCEFLNKKILKKITKKHRLALSVDMDCISSASGLGASQIFPIGFNANEFLMAWRQLVSKFKPKLVGIYEVSPPLDSDFQLTRLAAILAHQFFYS